MKKLVLCLLLFSSSVWAQSLPICEGEGVQTIPIRDTSTSVQVHLNNYRNYLHGNRYELCFTYITPYLSNRYSLLTGPALYIPITADKQIVISGLDLRRKDEPTNKNLPLFESDGAEVILHNSKFTCATGSKPNSIGIKLLGDAHQIVGGSEIQNCGIGIQVGDAQMAGNNNLIQETKIHDNNTGIRIVNGQRNFIRRNSIYKNDANRNTIFEQEEGIFIAADMNGDLVPPILLNTGGAVAQEDDGILTYPEGVTDLPPDDQPPVQATFHVQPPYPSGSVEIYLVDSDPSPYSAMQRTSNNRTLYGKYQGYRFYAEAQCTLSATDYACQIPMTIGYEDEKVVLLFHDPDSGSTTFSIRILLNGQFFIPVSAPGPEAGNMNSGSGAALPGGVDFAVPLGNDGGGAAAVGAGTEGAASGSTTVSKTGTASSKDGPVGVASVGGGSSGPLPMCELIREKEIVASEGSVPLAVFFFLLFVFILTKKTF